LGIVHARKQGVKAAIEQLKGGLSADISRQVAIAFAAFAEGI